MNVPRGAAEGRAPTVEPLKSWVGGRVALIVAGIGLLGAALGTIWFGVAERAGLNPGGSTGMILVVAAAALLVIGLLLLLGGLGFYALAPAFMGAAYAWHGVGSHRLVIACTTLIVLLANTGPVAYMA